MNDIVDLDNKPVDPDDYEIVTPWFWQNLDRNEICALIATTFLCLSIIAVILFSIAQIVSSDRRLDLLLIETSLQLEAVADGCLHKGGK